MVVLGVEEAFDFDFDFLALEHWHQFEQVDFEEDFDLEVGHKVVGDMEADHMVVVDMVVADKVVARKVVEDMVVHKAVEDMVGVDMVVGVDILHSLLLQKQVRYADLQDQGAGKLRIPVGMIRLTGLMGFGQAHIVKIPGMIPDHVSNSRILRKKPSSHNLYRADNLRLPQGQQISRRTAPSSRLR